MEKRIKIVNYLGYYHIDKLHSRVLDILKTGMGDKITTEKTVIIPDDKVLIYFSALGIYIHCGKNTKNVEHFLKIHNIAYEFY